MLERIFLSGAFINFLLVILGGVLGVLFRKGIPERVQKILMQSMALCVIYIGVTGIFDDNAKILYLLIKEEIVDIKIVLKQGGMYHDKLAILEDFSGNTIACVGSNNESANGYNSNYEKIRVYKSWLDYDGRIHDETSEFNSIWNNENEELQVYDFMEAFKSELIDLDKWVNLLAKKIEFLITKGKKEAHLAEGFVAATLLFCVGAMTVVGSINSGILNDNTVLYSKGLIDCVAAIALASSLGAGVILSSVAVLAIEGTLILLATFIEPILTDVIISQMTVIGSLLIIAIAFNMLGLTKIKVMNCLPAIFLPILLCCFM